MFDHFFEQKEVSLFQNSYDGLNQLKYLGPRLTHNGWNIFDIIFFRLDFNKLLSILMPIIIKSKWGPKCKVLRPTMAPKMR